MVKYPPLGLHESRFNEHSYLSIYTLAYDVERPLPPSPSMYQPENHYLKKKENIHIAI